MNTGSKKRATEVMSAGGQTETVDDQDARDESLLDTASDKVAVTRELVSGSPSVSPGSVTAPTPAAGPSGHPSSGHPPRPTCIAVATGGIVTCADDGNVKLWDTDGKFIRDVGKHSEKAAYVTASGKYAFVASYDGTVKIWDTTKASGNKPEAEFKEHAANSEVWAVAVASNGTRAVSGTNGGEILMWDVDFITKKATQVGAPFDAGDGEVVAALAFRPGVGDSQFFSGHGGGMMRLWNANDPAKPPIEFSHENSHTLNSIAVTSDGLTAASCSLDMTVLIWDIDAGTHTAPLRHTDLVWRVAISGKKLASASQDGTVKVWELPGGTQRKSYPAGHGSMGVAFVNDLKIVYTGDGHGNEINFQDLAPWPW